MASFEKAIERVLSNEGGYINDLVDPGGETNFGISRKSYPTIDIHNLTLEQAKNIYRRDFWIKIRGNIIQDQEIANNLLDFAVNAGNYAAISTIQKILDCKVDGIMGGDTLAHINQFSHDLNDKLTKSRCLFYRSLVIKKPNLKKFLRGWLNRAESFA